MNTTATIVSGCFFFNPLIVILILLAISSIIEIPDFSEPKLPPIRTDGTKLSEAEFQSNKVKHDKAKSNRATALYVTGWWALLGIFVTGAIYNTRASKSAVYSVL